MPGETKSIRPYADRERATCMGGDPGHALRELQHNNLNTVSWGKRAVRVPTRRLQIYASASEAILGYRRNPEGARLQRSPNASNSQFWLAAGKGS